MRELQAVIGREAREQLLEAEGALPEAVVACVGGGSNAIGMFAGFIDDADVRLIGVEAAGAASLGGGRTGVLHGSRSSILADEDGQIADAHSISAGLDYPGVGPEHAFLRDTGRAEYVAVHRRGGARRVPAPLAPEGIIPALESSHALAVVDRIDAEYIAVCLSGRGDKDLAEVLAGARPAATGSACARHLVIYLMAGAETPALAARRGRRRRRHHRARLPLLRPARRRAGDPRRRREGARRRDAHAPRASSALPRPARSSATRR